MLRLRRTDVRDFWFWYANGEVDLYEINYYTRKCHQRTVVNDYGMIVAIASVDKDGEIGLLVRHDLLEGCTHRFLKLTATFLEEAFDYANSEHLFSGIKDNLRDLRWVKHLGFKKGTQLPQHTELGWTTYELPYEGG